MIEIFSGVDCVYCEKAKALLKRHRLDFQEYDIGEPAHLAEVQRRLPEARSIPQIFIDSEHVGGYTELEQLAKDGFLASLQAG